MFWSILKDSESGEEFLGVNARGPAVLLNPQTNKGTAFSQLERDELDLHGLIPPAVSTIEQQLARTYDAFQAKSTDLERYIYLASLQDRNETLFFRLVQEHLDEMMPIVYTPVVGEACQQFSHIYRRPRGLYISYEDRNNIEDLLANAPHPPAVMVVTDGERILGLGDQGVGGMGIPVGKLALYTLCSGIPPHRTLPILLDVGTDNQERLDDPLYLGLRHRRIRGEEYQDFIDRFVAAVRRVYPGVLLQWEDLLKANALQQLQRFRNRICSFNDDIQGTAAVVLAGILGALRNSGRALKDQRIVFAGAGASATGISRLLVQALRQQGLGEREAKLRIWLTDRKGLVTRERSGLEPFKEEFARDRGDMEGMGESNGGEITLEETVERVKPTILIGTSGTSGLFNEAMVRSMAEAHERPVVFPLSNPTSCTECTPEDALRWSEGRAIVATGSPFAPVRDGDRTFRIAQANNAFVFPGIGLGVWVSKARYISDGMLLEGARALASTLSDQDLASGAVLPEVSRIRECSRAVAEAVIREAIREGYADGDVLFHLDETLSAAMWSPRYRPVRHAPTLNR